MFASTVGILQVNFEGGTYYHQTIELNFLYVSKRLIRITIHVRLGVYRHYKFNMTEHTK